MTRAAVFTLMAASLIAAASTPVAAHHSFAMFDIVASKTITSTVKKVDWTNPHTWIWIEVPNDQGGTDTWGVEGMSPNYLARRGWTKSTLKPGDKVSLMIHPLKDGSRGGSFMSVKLPNGETLTMVGQPTEP